MSILAGCQKKKKAARVRAGLLEGVQVPRRGETQFLDGEVQPSGLTHDHFAENVAVVGEVLLQAGTVERGDAVVDVDGGRARTPIFRDSLWAREPCL